ncbi:hypothetical protein D3C81_1265460 [compost metagenome]
MAYFFTHELFVHSRRQIRHFNSFTNRIHCIINRLVRRTQGLILCFSIHQQYIRQANQWKVLRHIILKRINRARLHKFAPCITAICPHRYISIRIGARHRKLIQISHTSAPHKSRPWHNNRLLQTRIPFFKKLTHRSLIFPILRTIRVKRQPFCIGIICKIKSCSILHIKSIDKLRCWPCPLGSCRRTPCISVITIGRYTVPLLSNILHIKDHFAIVIASNPKQSMKISKQFAVTFIHQLLKISSGFCIFLRPKMRFAPHGKSRPFGYTPPI